MIIRPHRFAVGGAPFADFSNEQFYQASDAAVNDTFGYVVAMSGDGLTMAVGAPADDTSIGADAGSVYVFVRGVGNSWTEQARIQPTSNSHADQWFGSDLGISDDGNTLVIGSSHTSATDPGKAYVFTRSGTIWSQHTYLNAVATGEDASGRFGNSVAINSAGDTIAVGAPWQGASNRGAVWVFTLSGGVWSEQASNLEATGAAVSDYCCARLALSDDGGVLASSNSANSLDIFTRSGGVWSHSTRLTAAGYVGGIPNSITVATAISGDGKRVFLCLERETDAGNSAAGAVHEFTESGGVWTEGHRFSKETPAANLEYGWWACMNKAGDRAIMATNGAVTKTVEVWERIGTLWTREQTVTPIGGDADNFGSCSLDNTGLILGVGANGSDTGFGGAGAVFTFM